MYSFFTFCVNSLQNASDFLCFYGKENTIWDLEREREKEEMEKKSLPEAGERNRKQGRTWEDTPFL
jgi:hypothetical protein